MINSYILSLSYYTIIFSSIQSHELLLIIEKKQAKLYDSLRIFAFDMITWNRVTNLGGKVTAQLGFNATLECSTLYTFVNLYFHCLIIVFFPFSDNVDSMIRISCSDKKNTWSIVKIWLLQRGKVPVNRIWSRVRRRPYWSTALLAALKPSPYAEEGSDSIWCLKKSPSFLSVTVWAPFFDGLVGEEDELEATLQPEPEMISESNHIWPSTWQMPSSTSGLRERYPANRKIKISHVLQFW